MSRLALLALMTFTLVGAAWAASRDRVALWQVVQACLASHALTGGAFPCLEVNLSAGENRGFVVLRPPFGKPDTILSPTNRVVGVEDPALQAPQSPNYFEDAWNARGVLRRGDDAALAREDVALAVNSAFSRTQDQLHIHMGCLSGNSRRMLADIAPELRDDRWVRIKSQLHGLTFWGYRLGRDTLGGINPFALAARGAPGAAGDLADMMLLVAASRLPQGKDGFILLAARNDPLGPDRQFAAENFIDFYCTL